MRSKPDPVDQPERTAHYDCNDCMIENNHIWVVIFTGWMPFLPGNKQPSGQNTKEIQLNSDGVTQRSLHCSSILATVHLMRDAGKPVRQNNQLCTRYFFLFTTTVDEVHLGIVVRLFGQLVNFHSASAFYSHILTAALSLNKQHTK